MKKVTLLFPTQKELFTFYANTTFRFVELNYWACTLICDFDEAETKQAQMEHGVEVLLVDFSG